MRRTPSRGCTSQSERKPRAGAILKSMQKVATRVFITASVLFGVLGIVNLFTEPGEDTLLFKLFISTVFVILPSFALSIAGKYLNKS